MIDLDPAHKEAFGKFSREMIRTRDYDPNYFVVKGVVEAKGLDESQAYDYCVTFNAFYNFGSAEKFWNDPKLDVSKLACGQSRRSFRGNSKVLRCLRDSQEIKAFVFRQRNNGTQGWEVIYNAFKLVGGNGPWAAYYMADMMKVVLGFNITAPDVGELTSSGKPRGPIDGLITIANCKNRKQIEVPQIQRKLYEKALELAPFEGMECFESILCNYLSLLKKKYYVGRDIDRQIPMLEGLGEPWWSARRRYFPEEFLGELGGWNGIRKEKMGVL